MLSALRQKCLRRQLSFLVTRSFTVPYIACNPLELLLVDKELFHLKPQGWEILHEIQIENNTYVRGDMEPLFQPHSQGFSPARHLLGGEKPRNEVATLRVFL